MLNPNKKQSAFDKVVDSENHADWNEYVKWYKSPQVKFRLLPYVRDREFGLIVPKCYADKYGFRSNRFLKVTNVQSFDFYYDWTSMIEQMTYYQFYYTMAKYEGGLPHAPFRPKVRKAFKEDWIKNHWRHISAYDFYLDIDGENWDFEEAKGSAAALAQFFIRLKFPFYMRFSGQGFHFYSPYEFMKPFVPEPYLNFNPTSAKNIYKFYGQIALWLFDKYSEMIDTSIYDSRRFLKLPFTLAIYEKARYVCLPINSLQDLTDFKKENADLKSFKYAELVRHYPDKIWNKDGNASFLIQEFLKEVELK